MKWKGLLLIVPGIIFVLVLSSGHAAAEEKYKVHNGDTLSSIAEKKGVTISALKAINNLKKNNLKINQTLIIPSSKEQLETVKSLPQRKVEYYSVKKGDTLSRISSKTGIPLEKLRKINHLSKTRLEIGQRIALVEELKSPKSHEAAPAQISASPMDTAPKLESELANVNIPQTSDLSNINDEAIGDDAKQELLGILSTPAERQMLVKVALAFLGAPYRLGGSSVKGIDCSGYVKKIYALFGINLPRTAAEQSHVGVEVAKSNLTEGDLIFFNTNNRISHVGIYIGGNKFIHAASRNKGVRIDNLDSSYYKDHYKRAIRLKASDDAT